MKTKWIVVIGIVVVAAIIGGIFGLRGNNEGVIPPIDIGQQEEEEEEEPTPYVNIPVGVVFGVEPSVAMEKAVAPAYYEFGNVSPGGIIDTWTKVGMVNLGGVEVGYCEGEQLWLLIYNGKDVPVTFSLDVINAPKETNHSDITGQDYSKAPESFLVSVEVQGSITVEPRSAVKVPVSLQYPMDIEYPDQWEFRILVSTLGVPGSVATTLEPRFFTYMG